jgi:tetratricopeptide (TPR) repeat protein
LQDIGRHEEALATFDKALAIKPNLVEAAQARAATLEALGR